MRSAAFFVNFINTASFIVVGLRTLCIATTTIPPDFYETWKMTYYEASTAIQDREQKLEEAAELIEKASTGSFVCLHI